ncbi:hypothetical protein [Actinocorallia longicatena]|uniref:Uncharacterized protein n=1 Tax=Actinocorallia longicatena TaxID=111803 RepID=A0ABP6Q707_9ACTN
MGLDGQPFAVEDVPADLLVKDFARDTLYRISGIRVLAKLRVVLITGETPLDHLADERELDLASTLAVADVQDGCTVRISTVVWAGGFGIPEVSFYLGTAMATGMVGNLAYDIAKSALSGMRQRWSDSTWARRRTAITPREAQDIALGCICAKFDVEVASVSPVAAIPIVLRWDGTGIRKLRDKRFSSLHRAARAWRCVLELDEQALPDRIEVLVQANPAGADHTYVLLFRDS